MPDSDSQTDTTATTKITRRGNILVRNTADKSILGYVSSTLSGGRIAYQDISHALTVSFTTDPTDPGSQLNIIPEVGLGLLQSRAPLSYHLVHFLEFEWPKLRLPWSY